jgi:hypothetical protein
VKAADLALVGALIYRVPILLPLTQVHLDDYDELLPHVLLGEITRWAVQRYEADPADGNLHAALNFMEEAFAADGADEIELIAASFLENLPTIGEDGAEIRALLGPAMTEWLRRFG